MTQIADDLVGNKRAEAWTLTVQPPSILQRHALEELGRITVKRIQNLEDTHRAMALALADGEVGLAAEVRRVSQIQTRVKEAQRLGFSRCILPKANLSELQDETGGEKLELIGVTKVEEAFKAALDYSSNFKK